MNKRIHVHLTNQPDPDYLNILKNKLPDSIDLSFGKPIKNHERIDYLIAGQPDRIDLDQCVNLKALIIPFAGIPEATRDLMKDYPLITVHNLHHNALPTAEHALALLLAASKHIIHPHNAMKNCDWRPRYAPNPSILLYGKKALILGYGNIGSGLSKMLNGLSMEVMAIRNSIQSDEEDEFAHIYPSRSLHALLPDSHVLINTLPLTASTKGFIGKQELALLPRGAVVVNIGRGEVIDQGAFYNALLSGHLGAAGIDVWYHYPDGEDSRKNTEPANYPFWELENVVLSPHRGGGLNSVDTEYLRMEHLAYMLDHAIQNEPLPNKVDIIRGY